MNFYSSNKKLTNTFKYLIRNIIETAYFNQIRTKYFSWKTYIKGTRTPVTLIYELIGLNYSISDSQEEYSHLDPNIILKVIELGSEAVKNLSNINLDEILSKEKY
ncbi:MAG: DUF433 domain-containing protein [Candidatus Lokiarchaeota archaeon]|nr:DUF433 domain-containing protein [Candidatus Lokiarchaeota archaeon]